MNYLETESGISRRHPRWNTVLWHRPTECLNSQLNYIETLNVETTQMLYFYSHIMQFGNSGTWSSNPKCQNNLYYITALAM